MSKKLPDYISHNLEVDLEKKRPVEVMDRISKTKAFVGVFVGYILIIAGIFSHFVLDGGTEQSQSVGKNELSAISKNTNFNDTSLFFDEKILFWILLLIGSLIIISQIITYLRSKKIIIGNRNITVFNRSIAGEISHFMEEINKYRGVRYRTKFFQYGIRHYLQHIIELVHEDESKTIPLFISRKVKDVRKKWEKTARRFGLPAIVQTVNGLKVRELEDLDKSVAQQVKEGKLQNDFDESSNIPTTLILKTKANKKILYTRSYHWDLFSFFLGMAICFASIGLVLFLMNLDLAKQFVVYENLTIHSFFNDIILILGSFIVIPFFLLFKKQIIEIKDGCISNIYSWTILRIRTNKIAFDKIEAVDITSKGETTDYYLTITSDDETIHYGKKLDLETLEWTRSFIVNELCQ